MSSVVTLQVFPALRLGKLRDLLDVIAALRRIQQPINTPNGLRQAVQLLARVAELLGLDSRWTARLQSILDNPAVFDVVLAIVQYVSQQLADDRRDNGEIAALAEPTMLSINAQGFAEWLPMVLQIVDLLRYLTHQFD